MTSKDVHFDPTNDVTSVRENVESLELGKWKETATTFHETFSSKQSPIQYEHSVAEIRGFHEIASVS